MAAAAAIFLLGFLVGLLALALAEGAALLWAIRSLARPKPAPPPEPDAQLPVDDPPLPSQKQGYLWMLEQEKTPKVSTNRSSSSGGNQQIIRERRNIVEVFPLKMLARLEGHSLSLSGPDGSQITIELLDCTVVAVSASNLPSRKWAKRYPIKLESKESEICNGSKVCYVYAGTSWQKESWCKALRLASTTDKEKLKQHAMLIQEFRAYISSLNAGYPCFLKPSVFPGEEKPVVTDKAAKTDGSSKVRLFLRKFSKKASIKSSQASKTSPAPSRQDIKQPSTPSSSSGYGNRLSDSPDANVDERLDDEGTLCWNLLFSRLFFDVKMNDEINKAIKARIQRSLSNMRTSAYIGEITLTDLSLGGLPPCIRRMRVPPLDLNELWAFEVDFEYSSGILLHVATRLEVQEPELQNNIMKTTLEDDSNGNVNSDLLDSIERYGKQVSSSQAASAVEDKDEADALRRSKSTGWTSTYMSRWKNIMHSIADHVSQVSLSLAIKISSVRGTMRVHIKPPPTDRIWYGFTSMPELEWELESSVGDRKITNSHIASLIGNRIKASLHQTFVLPNCESVPISWMISDKEDWVPRKAAPFIWLNRETTAETASHTAERTTSSMSTAISRASKSSPPACSTRSDASPKNTATVVHGASQEPVAESSRQRFSLVSASGGATSLQSDDDANGQLRVPLLSSREFPEDDASENDVGSSLDSRALVVACAGDGEDGKRKRGRRARVMDLGRRMGGKLEEKRRHMEAKGKHIVDKMRENARNDGLPDLERATRASAADHPS